jgi:hypothetical protein
LRKKEKKGVKMSERLQAQIDKLKWARRGLRFWLFAGCMQGANGAFRLLLMMEG